MYGMVVVVVVVVVVVGVCVTRGCGQSNVVECNVGVVRNFI